MRYTGTPSSNETLLDANGSRTAAHHPGGMGPSSFSPSRRLFTCSSANLSASPSVFSAHAVLNLYKFNSSKALSLDSLPSLSWTSVEKYAAARGLLESYVGSQNHFIIGSIVNTRYWSGANLATSAPRFVRALVTISLSMTATAHQYSFRFRFKINFCVLVKQLTRMYVKWPFSMIRYTERRNPSTYTTHAKKAFSRVYL